MVAAIRNGAPQRQCRNSIGNVIDFISGEQRFEHTIEVDFRSPGGPASMVVTMQPHLDTHWTRMAVEGFNSKLANLDRRFGGPARKLTCALLLD